VVWGHRSLRPIDYAHQKASVVEVELVGLIGAANVPLDQIFPAPEAVEVLVEVCHILACRAAPLRTALA